MKIAAGKWIFIKQIADVSDKRMYKAKLHDGEVEVMILARELNADLVVIDDLAARKTAEFLGLTLTGTIGILIKAKKLNIIDSVMPLIEKMEEAGIYFSDALLKRIIELTSER